MDTILDKNRTNFPIDFKEKDNINKLGIVKKI